MLEIQTQMHFNSDMTKMVATVTMEDGAVHVGWIDESGTFTDVSEKVTAVSSFSGLTYHVTPCFGPDNYFYFRDETADDIPVKRVPVDDVREETVEIMLEDDPWPGAELQILPDGRVVEDTPKWYYYDESMSYPASCTSFGDWLSPSECVGKNPDDDMIYRITLSGVEYIFDWDLEWTPLVPDIKGRTNWNPVVSPGCDSVAFLSKLTSGTDTAPYLYVVSLDGGEPIKVDADYSFSDHTYLVDWLPGAGEEQAAYSSAEYLVDIEPVQCDDAVFLEDSGTGKSITGEIYAHHIYAQEAGASVTWELDGSFHTLTGLWSICDTCRDMATSEAFEIYTDGVLAYTSPTLTGEEDPVDVELDLNGCKELKIVFTSGIGCGEFANVLLS